MDLSKVILIYRPPITTIESYCCDGGIVLCDRGAMVFELATLPKAGSVAVVVLSLAASMPTSSLL